MTQTTIDRPHVLAVDPNAAAAYRTGAADVRASSADDAAPLLAEIAQRTRRSIITMINSAGLGHVGGDLSVTDILTVAYWAVLDLDPEQPRAEDRDRFVLSKGHCAAALYATLAHCGYFPVDELETFMAPLSPLNGHPNRVKVPGVETNTGPLGHGLPVATGIALGAKIRSATHRTIAVMGDGELQEGTNWEAAMAAAHYGLDNLTAVVDRNRLQQGAGTEDTNGLDDLPDRWRAFGWEVREIDGHDYAALINAFAPSTTGRPVAIIANTIKGKGVSFMEDRVEWHHKVPSAAQVAAALEELS